MCISPMDAYYGNSSQACIIHAKNDASPAPFFCEPKKCLWKK